MAKSTPLPADLDELIRAVLKRAGKGLSARQVHTALPRAGRPSRTVVAERVSAMAAGGAVHPWPGGKSPLFGAQRFEDHLRDRIQAAVLAEGARSEAQLRKGVPRQAHPQVREVLDGLVRAGRLHHHPKVGGRDVFGAEPPDPGPALGPLVEAAIQKVVKRGFREADVRAALARLAGVSLAPAPVALPPEESEELIRRTILELNPRAAGSALVYVPHLRIAIGDRLDKPALDRALLGLLSQERIQLQAHPVPSQLKPEEKEAMVPDGRGSFYMAVGLR